jgi:hypothetical protein
MTAPSQLPAPPPDGPAAAGLPRLFKALDARPMA